MKHHQGTILRELIRSRSISIPAFARSIGIRREYVYELFNKEILSSDIIIKIADTYNVPASIFFPLTRPVSIIIANGIYEPDKDIMIPVGDILTVYRVPGS